jgi:hypothetical protein
MLTLQSRVRRSFDDTHRRVVGRGGTSAQGVRRRLARNASFLMMLRPSKESSRTPESSITPETSRTP